MVRPSAGAKQRVMNRCKYRPSSARKAARAVRVIAANGATQTFKKKGDLVINERGLYEVTRHGYS